MRPDLVIFDCDGVLVDSEPPVFRVVTAELRALGLDVTLEETMATHKGKTLEQSRPLIEARLGRALPADWAAKLRQRLGRTLSALVIANNGFNIFGSLMLGGYSAWVFKQRNIGDAHVLSYGSPGLRENVAFQERDDVQ